MHGWGISQRIQQTSKGMLEVNQGSLYPALQRLEKDGLIASDWGDDRQQPPRALLPPHRRRTPRARPGARELETLRRGTRRRPAQSPDEPSLELDFHELVRTPRARACVSCSRRRAAESRIERRDRLPHRHGDRAARARGAVVARGSAAPRARHLRRRHAAHAKRCATAAASRGSAACRSTSSSASGCS